MCVKYTELNLFDQPFYEIMLLCFLCQAFETYGEMVDKARKVDVEGSMAKRQWSTDEFQHVLAIHSDQIREMKSMARKKRLGFIKV